MKSALMGIAAFIVCGLLAALLLPDVRGGGAYYPKQLLIKVRVIDADSHLPVQGATVTFFIGSRERDLAAAQPPTENTKGDTESAVTDDQGYAEVMGSFRATDNRRGRIWRRRAWYRLSGEWLGVVVAGRPVAYLWLNGHQFGGERDYERDEPLEVLVVMNKVLP